MAKLPVSAPIEAQYEKIADKDGADRRTELASDRTALAAEKPGEGGPPAAASKDCDRVVQGHFEGRR